MTNLDPTITTNAGVETLRADLHAIKSQVGLTGQRRLIADGDSDGHADRFWAAALAAGAARTTYQPYAYRPVPRASGADDDRPLRATRGMRALPRVI